MKYSDASSGCPFANSPFASDGVSHVVPAPLVPWSSRTPLVVSPAAFRFGVPSVV